MSAEDNGGGQPGDDPFVALVSSVTSAEINYGPLLGVIGGEIRGIPKNLEVCAGDTTPPPDYGFDTEVEGIKAAAEAAGQMDYVAVKYRDKG